MSRSHEQVLAHEPWYHGLLPREEMKVLLTQKGDFLVRFTDPKVGEPRKFVLSIFVGSADDIRHYVLRECDGKFAVDAKWFSTIPELLNYYHRTKEPVAVGCFESVLTRPVGREPWEKQHSDVTLIKKLGEGAFGEVQLGEIRIGTTVKKAAIKLAKLEALTKEQIKEIMHEARLMRKFKHPNVVTFYGVAAGQEPLMVIMELADNGALDSYLKKNIGNLSIAQKNDMIVQAACGLQYLHSLQVIHRDIASRNCLYGNGQVKISDFGLSREGSSYRLNPHKKVPIRWLAPEVPKTGYYTSKTDVFAYGIMCWEVYHDGDEPYPGMAVAEVLPRVQDGYRMTYVAQVPEKVVRYLTDRVCAGTESDRVSMMDVVFDLPRLEGFEQKQKDNSKSSSFFEIPGDKEKKEKAGGSQMQEVRPSPLINILPYPSQPVATPAAAGGAPVQIKPEIDNRKSVESAEGEPFSKKPQTQAPKKTIPVKMLSGNNRMGANRLKKQVPAGTISHLKNVNLRKKYQQKWSAEKSKESTSNASAEMPSRGQKVKKK